MKIMTKFAVALILLHSSPRIIGQSKLPEDMLPKEVRETSVTACWIEYPLRKVLSDLKGVEAKIDLGSSVSSDVLGTPITLEIMDIGFEQVLQEILSPLGLAYKVKDGTVLISQIPHSDEKPQKPKRFFSQWRVVNDLPFPAEMLLSEDSKKRHGHIYLTGRIDEIESSLDFTKNKKIHRWISSRAQITITKHFIPNKKSHRHSKVSHRWVPVVELVSNSDNPTD